VAIVSGVEAKIFDSIEVEELKFYVTHIRLLDNKRVVFEEFNSFHLVDWQDSTSLRISLKVPSSLQYSKIVFDLGVDSLTHISGAFGGDLDPMHGMYWAWQSGYINFKLEGTSPSCPARQHRFQFHVGGYQSPHESMRQIELPVKAQATHIILVHIDKIFAQLDLSKNYQLMRPGAEASALADLLVTIFSSKS